MAAGGRRLVWALGVVASALGASLCCILPVAVALLGVGSAALGAALEPWRPVFLLLTVGFLGYAFHREYRRGACAPGEVCPLPAERRRARVVLWVVAVVAVALVTFPYYSSWLL